VRAIGFAVCDCCDHAFSFVELMATITIFLLLTTMAVPLARIEVRRTKEFELRRDLREMREAIDR